MSFDGVDSVAANRKRGGVWIRLFSWLMSLREIKNSKCVFFGLSRIHKAEVLRLIWFPTLVGRLITVAAKSWRGRLAKLAAMTDYELFVEIVLLI
nr:hypothetical protein [Tanacetum cinerariifolium]